MSRYLIRDIQRERVAKFPSDRICFAHSVEAANADRQCIKAYINGQMPMRMLRNCLARNNYLLEVTEAQVINELQIMGWL